MAANLERKTQVRIDKEVGKAVKQEVSKAREAASNARLEAEM